jgi:hypothetical protein
LADKMNRPLALQVLHEILDKCHESVVMNSVSLDVQIPSLSEPSDEYEIKMKCTLNSYSRKCLQPIIEKHELKVEESIDTVTIKSR